MKIEDLVVGKLYESIYHRYINLYDSYNVLSCSLVTKIFPRKPFLITDIQKCQFSVKLKVLTDEGYIGCMGLDNHFIQGFVFPAER